MKNFYLLKIGKSQTIHKMLYKSTRCTQTSEHKAGKKTTSIPMLGSCFQPPASFFLEMLRVSLVRKGSWSQDKSLVTSSLAFEGQKHQPPRGWTNITGLCQECLGPSERYAQEILSQENQKFKTLHDAAVTCCCCLWTPDPTCYSDRRSFCFKELLNETRC